MELALGKRQVHVTPGVHLEPPGVATGASWLWKHDVQLVSMSWTYPPLLCLAA